MGNFAISEDVDRGVGAIPNFLVFVAAHCHATSTLAKSGAVMVVRLLPIPSMDPIVVDEVMMKEGDTRQVVWYWLQQRQRNLTNECLVKWYLLWDAVTQGRNDGTLIRCTSPITSDDEIPIAKARMKNLINESILG